MKILNLLAAGTTGGIEVLLRDIVNDNTLDNRICFMFGEGDIYEELKQKTAKVFSLKSKNKNKKEIVKEIVKYCINEKIDIITVHHGGINCNLIYIMLKKKLPHIKFVRYFHSSFDEYWAGRKNIKGIITKVVMQKAINESDLLIFISKAVEKTFNENFKIDKKSVEIVYNGINNKYIDKKIEKRANENVNIIYVGRLVALKGVDILIKAFEGVYEKYPKSQLTIVGDGSEKNKLYELAKGIKGSENIFFTGRKENVIDWLDKADIFVYPSICQEGFGISVAEAMARGRIPITFNKGGLPELISNGQNGFLVEQVDYIKLSEAILNVIKMNDSEKNKIINNAIDTAQNFSIKNTVNKLKNVYEKIIEAY